MVGVHFAGSCLGVAGDFGFSGDRAGMDMLFNAIFEHREDAAVQARTVEVERLLRVPRGSWFAVDGAALPPGAANAASDGGAAGRQTAADGREESDEAAAVEVRVKHAYDQDEVHVSVSSAATMRDVKEAVAVKLGRADVLEAGRIVKPQGQGTFLAYKE